MRVAGYCEKVLAHQDKRACTYTSYSDLLAKLKVSKDINAFLVSILNLYLERDIKVSKFEIALNFLSMYTPT